MKRDRLNDDYHDLIEKQRQYFKTVKDMKEVRCFSSTPGLLSTSVHDLSFP